MRITRTLLPLTFSLMTACYSPAALRTRVISAPQSMPSATAAASASAPITAPPVTEIKYNVTNFASLSAAFENLLTDSVKVVAIGEIHKSHSSNLPSTMSYFKDALPIFSQRGFKDLVFEPLPSNAKAESEAKLSGKTRGYGPFLNDWFAYHDDYCGIFLSIVAASSSGIAVHGVHFRDTKEQEAQFSNLAVLITSRARMETHELLAKDKKVIIYTGAVHNDIDPLTFREQLSFGKDLRKELDSGYIEVDIFLPELADNVPSDVINMTNYKNYIPTDGVNVVNPQTGRYVILLPKFNGQVVNSIPEKNPACH